MSDVSFLPCLFSLVFSSYFIYHHILSMQNFHCFQLHIQYQPKKKKKKKKKKWSKIPLLLSVSWNTFVFISFVFFCLLSPIVYNSFVILYCKEVKAIFSRLNSRKVINGFYFSDYVLFVVSFFAFFFFFFLSFLVFCIWSFVLMEYVWLILSFHSPLVNQRLTKERIYIQYICLS